MDDKERAGAPSTLSDRSLADSQAEMGYGTTRPLERVMASCGLLASAELEFVAADDVPNGGVLCALSALLAEGLLRHTRSFYRLGPGFYPLESIFLALALLALVRCRSLEQSRYLSPGEWGKLLGLDRLPEVKNLRRKISALCAHGGCRCGSVLSVTRVACASSRFCPEAAPERSRSSIAPVHEYGWRLQAESPWNRLA